MLAIRGPFVLLLGALALFLANTQAAPGVLYRYLHQYDIPAPRHTYHVYPKEKLDHGLKRNDDDSIKVIENNKESRSGMNPCVDYPDHPFPCKTTNMCLPISYVCDNNPDCADESDEESDMCTAANRPPVDEIKQVLEKADWLMPLVFPGQTANHTAHALAVSPTLKDFGRKMHFNADEVHIVKVALEAIKQNNEQLFEELGMPPGQWHKFSSIFSKLLSTGFDQVY